MAVNQFFQCFCINRLGLGPLHYLSSCSDFGFEFSEIFVFENRLPASVRRGVDKISWSIHFFKPLNNSIVIVHYIPGLFFDKLVLWKHCLAVKSTENRHHINFFFEYRSHRISVSVIRGIGDFPTQRYGESVTHRITGAGSRRLSLSSIRRVFFKKIQ